MDIFVDIFFTFIPMSCFQLDPRYGPFYFLERYSAKKAFDISRILCDNNKKSDKTYCRFIHKKINLQSCIIEASTNVWHF